MTDQINEALAVAHLRRIRERINDYECNFGVTGALPSGETEAIDMAISSLERQRAQINSIPDTWLDSLLTGPDAVIGKPPYNCKDIERLLNAIRKRIETPEET